MNRLLTIGLISAALAACGGEPEPDKGTDPVTPVSSVSEATTPSSSSAPVVSSVSSVMSSVAVSSVASSIPASSSVSAPSSAPVASSSAPSGFDGDATNGLALFSSKLCVGCHLDLDGDGFFSDKANHFDPDSFGNAGALGTYDASTPSGVATFIKGFMSAFAAGGCDEQCSKDIAAYLWSQKNGVVGPLGEAVSCANPAADAIHYGRRALHVLTSYEYHNSLSKLFGEALPADYSSASKVSVDTELARLPNHISENISETRLNGYYDNAVELADWAIATPGALAFDCSDADSCATNVISEFAYEAYRRLLTPEERTEFRDMIGGATDLNTGLKWAITTVLSSPHFLYRSELGRTVADALVEKPIEPDPNQIAIANPIFIEFGEVTYDAKGFGGFGAHKYVGTTPNYNWTGNDVVKVTVSGTGKFGLKVDNKIVTEMELTSSAPKTLTFKVTHAMGSGKYVQAYNASGNPIKVSKVTIGTVAVAEPPAQEDKTLLAKADPDAYVLNSFEYASALSFALTGSAPSRQLLDAAKAGELFDAAKLDGHIDALIDSDLGKAHIERLAGKWFRTDKLPTRTRNVAEFTPEVRDSMMQEIREIYKHVFYNGDFPSMYAGDFTYLDSTLASFYGMAGQGGASNGDFSWVDTSGELRGGIIASGGFMAYNAHMDYTSPIQRAAHFRQDVLCQAIPQPTNLEDSDERDKAGLRAAERAKAGTITTAEYYDIQTNVEGSSCAGCHNAILNPLFGLDDFDNVGRLRKRVNGDVVQDGLIIVNGVAVPKGEADLAIDFVNKDGYLFSPKIVGTLSTKQADIDKAAGEGLKFSGAKDLGQKIVAEDVPGISACLIEKTTRYAMGYTLRKDLLEDAELKGASYLNITDAQEAEFVCVQDELNAAYNVAKSPRDVLKALVKSSAFRFRK
ncbi:DUF1592 domain-containing protein [Marinagarivorans algicola]|uniref:DUF1592 domain-containing protein n=1 Tax=Marinagarivorans algicola TaxID=1513270 RepID=UPI000ACD6EA5|nr:DUF1592 domain-containing protein [Marinagarivorans algicola]